MLRNIITVAIVGCLVVVGGTSVANAQVGNPTGSFDITVRQGGSIIAQDTVTIGVGGDLEDLQATFQDGDPEDFTQIGTVGSGASETPIILKVTSDGDSSFRVLHWYIDVPASLTDIYSPGATSLFDPMGGDIDVSITGLEFDGGTLASPLLVGNDTYLTSFMRDWQGHYYESTSTNPFNYSGYGVDDIQVPGMTYLDGDLSEYRFDVSSTGASSSWTWGNLVNPGLSTKVHNGYGSTTPLDPGYVFELGLSVAFVAVPEPATLTMLIPGLILLARKRRATR